MWEPFPALPPECLASDQGCFVLLGIFAAVGSALRAWEQGAQRGLDGGASAGGTSLPSCGSRQSLAAQPLQHVPPPRSPAASPFRVLAFTRHHRAGPCPRIRSSWLPSVSQTLN